MKEYLIIHESLLGVGVCLVLLLVLAAGLLGYFKGLSDGIRKEREL